MSEIDNAGLFSEEIPASSENGRKNITPDLAALLIAHHYTASRGALAFEHSAGGYIFGVVVGGGVWLVGVAALAWSVHPAAFGLALGIEIPARIGGAIGNWWGIALRHVSDGVKRRRAYRRQRAEARARAAEGQWIGSGEGASVGVRRQ